MHIKIRFLKGPLRHSCLLFPRAHLRLHSFWGKSTVDRSGRIPFPLTCHGFLTFSRSFYGLKRCACCSCQFHSGFVEGSWLSHLLVRAKYAHFRKVDLPSRMKMKFPDFIQCSFQSPGGKGLANSADYTDLFLWSCC